MTLSIGQRNSTSYKNTHGGLDEIGVRHHRFRCLFILCRLVKLRLIITSSWVLSTNLSFDTLIGA